VVQCCDFVGWTSCCSQDLAPGVNSALLAVPKLLEMEIYQVDRMTLEKIGVAHR